MASPLPVEDASPANDVRIVATAVLRAADLLGLRQAELAAVLGVSEATVSRMRSDAGRLPGGKPFQLALLLIRLYRSLVGVFGADPVTIRAWMRGENLALRGVPALLVVTPEGLVRTLEYADAARAPV
jgi:transcriptional regulator with XRE-family HTH domain